MGRERSLRVLLAAGLVVGAFVVTSPPAQASFHLNKIVAVFTGHTNGAVDAQYVELRSYSQGQNLIRNHTVDLYDATGAVTQTVTFDHNVANPAGQASILIATADAETFFDIQADFPMEPVLDPAGGAVCFETIDCVAWGSYAGDTALTGNPFKASTGLNDGRAMARNLSGGTRANLDAGDDSNDSASDFGSDDPAPTNNAGDVGVPNADPPPPPPPPDDTVAPVSFVVKPADSETYRRVRNAKGSASDELGVTVVKVALMQKRKDRSCRWWHPEIGRFTPNPCSARVYFDATGTTAWTVPLPSLKTSMGSDSKIKSYTIFSAALDEAGNFEATFERGRNMNRFEVRR